MEMAVQTRYQSIGLRALNSHRHLGFLYYLSVPEILLLFGLLQYLSLYFTSSVNEPLLPIEVLLFLSLSSAESAVNTCICVHNKTLKLLIASMPYQN